jgi:uncharacterized protein (TIGR02145 family)
MNKILTAFVLTLFSNFPSESNNFKVGYKTFDTVIIGSQIWHKKNLDVSQYSDGTPIPLVTNKNEFYNLKTGAWMYYKNNSKFGEKYGKLYNWYAVAGIYNNESLYNIKLRKKLAPKGWKIPSKNDYQLLIDFLGGNKVAGGKLKEKGTLNWISPNTGATNSSGFTALPGGGDALQVLFLNGYVSNLWCSTLYEVKKPWYLALEYKKSDAEFYDGKINDAYYVRCLKE